MGKVARFIDHCCERHPELMRAVMERPLAPLSEFIAFDQSGQQCGCLIGTCMIEAGFRDASIHAFASPVRNEPSYIRSGGIDAGFKKLARYLGGEYSANHLAEIGRDVWLLSRWVAGYHYSDVSDLNVSLAASDAKVVHLIRQRIARQLAVRESALPLGSPLPNEPVEREVARV